MSKVVFIFNGLETNIQCSKEDKMKDICYKLASKIQFNINDLFFIYEANQIDFEKKFIEQANSIDKKRKAMNILVIEKAKETKIYLNEGIIKSKEVICPKCGENCLLNLDDFKIKLFGCKNGHEVNHILLNEFNNTQNINENNIICNICNKINRYKAYNKEFFFCLNCKKNLCPLCKSIHDKPHKIIDYDKKNYVCQTHNDQYYSYCNECKINLCLLCKSQHNKEHEIINFENIIPNEDEIKE